MKPSSKPMLGVFAMLAALSAGNLLARELNPPSGAIGATMKPLNDVEPRIAINEQTCPGGPTWFYGITQPGSYYLTGNLDLPNTKIPIAISASNVTVDLNGFCIGSSDSIFAGVGAFSGHDSTVRNGSILNCGSGVNLVASSNCRVENVQVRGVAADGIRVGPGGVVQDCSVYDCGEDGIEANRWSRIAGCVVLNPGGRGITTYGDCTIIDCQICDVNLEGIWMGTSSRAVNCDTDNAVGDGISLSHGRTFVNCTATNGDTDGFQTAGRATVRDCVSTSNALAGFRVNGTCMIRNCVASSNQTGIRSDTGAGLLISENEGSDNTGFGIWMNGATGCRIEGNALYSNTASGLYMNANGENLAIRNTARGNGWPSFNMNSGNDCATVIANCGSGFTNTNPWANIEY